MAVTLRLPADALAVNDVSDSGCAPKRVPQRRAGAGVVVPVTAFIEGQFCAAGSSRRRAESGL